MMRRNAQQCTIYQEEKSSSERATNSTIQVPKNKKQKEIIEKFSQQKDRIHPDMYATEEEIAETEERHEGWKRELKE